MSRVLANPEAVSAGSLSRFEIPDCGCFDPRTDEGFPPPCRHILARRHNLSLDKWAELQRLLAPSEYNDPPPPGGPAIALRRAARIEVYTQRHAAGLALYHQGDVWRRKLALDALVTAVSRGRNGSVAEGALQLRGSA